MRKLRNWGVAVVVILASLLLVPRASQAACGDYVQVSGRTALMHDSMENQSTTRDGSMDETKSHHAPRLPCHGPGCSNRSLPPAVPVPNVVVSFERWAVASGDTPPDSVSCNSMLAEPVDIVEDGFRLSILRPPR